jgi:hypothetical protein
MNFNLIEVIQKSIPEVCSSKQEKQTIEAVSVGEFFNRISSNNDVNLSSFLVDLVRAFLQNKFSISIRVDQQEGEVAYISAPSKRMLLEPNFLIRFIEYMPEIIHLVDEIGGAENRIKVLTNVTKEFERRNLFIFLNQAEADPVEKLCMLTILHLYIKGEACPSIQEVCKYLPKSKYLQFVNRVQNDSSILIQQKLIKMSSDNFRFDAGLKLQSRGIGLMCNELISLI